MFLSIIKDLNCFVEKEEDRKFHVNNKGIRTVGSRTWPLCVLAGYEATSVAIEFPSFSRTSPSDK